MKTDSESPTCLRCGYNRDDDAQRALERGKTPAFLRDMLYVELREGGLGWVCAHDHAPRERIRRVLS